ncbi:hypothetical protein ACIA5C_15565 [Actinoplanes sp. NPDC051343]|uniref:hypothetical protein n=1 Tax=Actinoplanes sp. NPDC051343 TaxID=3363906 RepID=UPI00379FB305
MVTHGEISGADNERRNPGGNRRQGGLPQPLFPYGMSTVLVPTTLLVRRPLFHHRSRPGPGHRRPQQPSRAGPHFANRRLAGPRLAGPRHLSPIRPSQLDKRPRGRPSRPAALIIGSENGRSGPYPARAIRTRRIVRRERPALAPGRLQTGPRHLPPTDRVTRL